MAKVKISDFSSTPGNNTEIDNINISEGCAPSGINDAIRELMAQLKDFQTGAAGDSFNGPVGTTTAAAGAFTTLTASSTATLNTLASSGATLTGGTINGMAIGGTTAAAVSATTLTTSSTVTLNGGTANGVAYLNGSKVLTTGSALTFDGSSSLVVSTSASNGVVAVVGPSSGTNNGAQFQIINGASITSAIGTYSRIIGGAYNESLAFYNNGNDFVWYSGSERMRLTSTGLGIGTSSPDAGSGAKLTTRGIYVDTGGGDAGYGWQIVSTTSGAAPLQLIAPAITFSTGANLARSVKATLDSSGNLGLGVTPSAWYSTYKAIELPDAGFFAFAGAYGQITANAYYDGAYKYKTTAAATQYAQASGQHQWFTAPSGTAGNAISFTQAMTLTAAGDLLVGTTSNIASGYRINIAPASSQAGGIAWKNFDTTGTSPFAVFLNSSGSVVGSIDVGNAATVYSTSSDYRLKNITGPITTSGAYIDSLNPVEGTWKADGSTFVGLIAHEVQEASRTTVATGVKDGEEMQGMDYSSAEIIANLIAEVKSLRQRLAAAGI